MESSQISLDRTLGSLVSEQINRARVLEWFGLDYCCGGKQSLGDACSEQGIDLEKVMTELKKVDSRGATPGSDNLNSLSIKALIEQIIETHHSYLRLELPRLTQLTTKIASVHGENHPELTEVRDSFAQLRSNLEVHMQEEEESLFPTLRLLESSGDFSMLVDNAKGLIIRMEDDHVAVGAMLERIHKLTDGYKLPSDGCETYRVTLHGLMTLEQDIHLHVHKENNILFPKALSNSIN